MTLVLFSQGEVTPEEESEDEIGDRPGLIHVKPAPITYGYAVRTNSIISCHRPKNKVLQRVLILALSVFAFVCAHSISNFHTRSVGGIARMFSKMGIIGPCVS